MNILEYCLFHLQWIDSQHNKSNPINKLRYSRNSRHFLIKPRWSKDRRRIARSEQTSRRIVRSSYRDPVLSILPSDPFCSRGYDDRKCNLLLFFFLSYSLFWFRHRDFNKNFVWAREDLLREGKGSDEQEGGEIYEKIRGREIDVMRKEDGEKMQERRVRRME